MLVLLPAQRLTIPELLEHPWMTDTPSFQIPRSLAHTTKLMIDEEIVRYITKMGFPKSYIVNSLKMGEYNHATAAYYLLI
jgi:hypothetical protein